MKNAKSVNEMGKDLVSTSVQDLESSLSGYNWLDRPVVLAGLRIAKRRGEKTKVAKLEKWLKKNPKPSPKTCAEFNARHVFTDEGQQMPNCLRCGAKNPLFSPCEACQELCHTESNYCHGCSRVICGDCAVDKDHLPGGKHGL